MEDQDRSFNTFMYQYFLMPSKFRIILASLLDVFILIGLLLCIAFFYLIPYKVTDESIAYGIAGAYLFFMAIIQLTILKFGFASLGHLLLGLTHVSGLSGRRLERIDYISLWYESFLLGFKYAGIYTTYHFLTSDFNQSMVLEENNVFIVKRRKYNYMIKNKLLIITK
jgi:hypothetical protein